jgi:cell division protein FtsB
MGYPLKDMIFRYGSIAMALAILGTGVFFLVPTYRRSQDLKAQEAKCAESIERVNREISALREKQRRFHGDNEFIESIARQNNRVYPGELVFIFED